jgi:uncharacterized protein YecT (DUF1311 family)
MIIELALSVALTQIRPDERLCDDSGTTVAVNACLAEKLKKANERLDSYLKAALERHAEENEAAVRLGIQASQNAFEAYRSIECDAVFEDWKEGTIRGAMSLGCRIALTDRRTHDVWRHWLQYMDNTPPILPEPTDTE